MTLEELLKENGLEQYIHLFEEHDISDSLLASLSDDDLIEIGITSLGHRRKILLAVKDNGGEHLVATSENIVSEVSKSVRTLIIMAGLFSVPALFVTMFKVTEDMEGKLLYMIFSSIFLIGTITIARGHRDRDDRALGIFLMGVVYVFLSPFSWWAEAGDINTAEFYLLILLSIPGISLFLAAYLLKRP
jgi:hypothetical protein